MKSSIIGSGVPAVGRRRWDGFHPEIGYTRYDGRQVHYYNHRGRHIGSGSMHDNIFFLWIPNEAARRHPRQIIDYKRFYGMVKDGEPTDFRVDRQGLGAKR